MNKNYHADQFLSIYESLNAEQKRAVDTLEGPVMVVAGPGTGKTQILGARIGKILLETDTLPQHILCLTYTEAGVVAMRKRLTGMIGPDAYKVNIHTFHAFCHTVIQENLHLFEKNTLEPISELERIELYRELINKFPNHHPLKRFRGDVYTDLLRLQNLFSDMKREGWSPGFITERIDRYLEDLPNRPEYRYKKKTGEFKVGDLRTQKLQEETEKMEKLRAAVGEFDRLQDLMRARDRYDFDDMITWVVRAFQENEPLLRNYQERFLYILVDEFQDTSGIQNRLIELLINYWDKPNIFVVGDDDQSIFRFQGANFANLLHFNDQYRSDILTVVLSRNYRSTQAILDSAKHLIGRNQERLILRMPGLSKDLKAERFPAEFRCHPPMVLEYDTQRQEMAGISFRILQLLEEGVPPGRIAVIYKENRYGEELIHYCKLQQIPIYARRSVNILTLPLVKKIILLLTYLAGEQEIPFSGSEMLFEILHFDSFHIPALEIARLVVEVAEREFTENKTSLRELLYQKSMAPPQDLFSPGLRKELRMACQILESLISEVHNLTLQGLFERCIRESGILSGIMESPDKLVQMEILTALFEFIKEETRRQPFLSLQDFVSRIGLMKEEGIPLPLNQVSGSENGVNLLTAHGSKGLEFEWVFIAGCNADLWEKKRNPSREFNMPDNLIIEGSSSEEGAKQDEELRRLFYVAMTRAEQHLMISYCRFTEQAKLLEPSQFVAEVLEGLNLPVEKVFLNPDELTRFRAVLFTEEPPEMEKVEEEFVSRLLDRFVLSVTALNNYLNCPLEFYYRNLLRIPSPKNEAMEFGSAVHFALEQLFRKMQKNQDQFPAKEVLLEDFDLHMHRHRESFTREQFERRLAYGHRVLPAYYDNYVNNWNRIVVIERNIRNVVLAGVPLKGKLDKLEFTGKSVNIVDYKTGDPDNAALKIKQPGASRPNGGDYWRQAVFYKILIDQYDRDWQAISTEFDFIEPDKKKAYRKMRLIISPEDISTVTRQITDTWQKIQQHDFYTGCGKADCDWCNFVKTNRLTATEPHFDEEEA